MGCGGRKIEVVVVLLLLRLGDLTVLVARSWRRACWMMMRVLGFFEGLLSR